MPDERLRQATQDAQASLARLREVLDDMEVQIGERPPRPVQVGFAVLSEEDNVLSYTSLALAEGETHETRIAFSAVCPHGHEHRESRVRVSVR